MNDKMKEIPRCFVESCNKQGLILLHGKFICGECYMEFYRKEQNNFWSRFNDGSN